MIDWFKSCISEFIKGEVQSRITIISKERVKIFPKDWCKNDENRIRNKEVVTFWNFTFFRKTFLDQSLWIFKWVSWWCHPLTIFYTFQLQNDKNLIFQLWECKPCLISTQNKWEIMFILIYFDTRICFYPYLEKNEKFQNFMYKMYDKLWGDDITNSLIWIFIRTGQEMFSEKIWNFNMSQLPYFLSDFHNFCTNL